MAQDKSKSEPVVEKTEERRVAVESVTEAFDFDRKRVVGTDKKGMNDADVLADLLKGGREAILPWEKVTLPSRGLYYDNLIPGGEVEVRPMGLDVEKILATARFAQGGKNLDMMFKRCIKFPSDFDPVDLLVGDRTFLLYYIRGITFGNRYEFLFTCPNDDCKETSTHVYDLNELARTIKPAKAELGKEPFRITLPMLSQRYNRDFWVKVRFMRGYDMQAIMQRAAIKKKVVTVGPRNVGEKRRVQTTMEMPDEAVAQNLYLLTTEILGSDDPMTIKKVIEELHSGDSSKIREFLDSNTPGMESQIMVTCPKCSQETRMALPITDGFFRAANTGGNGA